MPSSVGKILVSGSVVFDILQKKESFGGTAGNIAYGLGKLKLSPMLLSVVGGDFEEKYRPHLKKSGVDIRVIVYKNELCARFASDFDANGNLVSVWQPNVYKKINKTSLRAKINPKELQNTSVGIFSPGTRISILKHMREFKKYSPKGVAIFDPGQELHHFSKKGLLSCMMLCDIFILNEVEYSQATAILERDPLKLFPNKVIIKTLGSKGSIIYAPKKTFKIKAIKPKRVVDTTGAGDAYRVGLIYGLSHGKSILASCNLGAKISSKCVEYLGCQEYPVRV